MAEAILNELGAVNQMLLTIGEQKVNSLESTGVLEVEITKTTLQEVSRTVQGEDWYFNIEHSIRLMPENTGYIMLPHNCTKVWQPPRSTPMVVQRGRRLYNMTNHTYTFDRPVTVSMRYFLDFDDLIPSAAHYIALRASRRFQERITGSQVTEEFLIREEVAARAVLVADDASLAGFNILTDNQPTRSTVGRDRWLR
ncbi:MAG: hypothetical protein LIQ30_12920 [Planctomycetes bacterium]|nr:hypothetical protein [Planctomycetota bacterium]MCC8116667.1 hypothetical protein [Planctomycetota bacterium]MCD7896371.1 hypothetical protein [Planctomycetaceae bacterium]